MQFTVIYTYEHIHMHNDGYLDFYTPVLCITTAVVETCCALNTPFSGTFRYSTTATERTYQDQCVLGPIR